MEAKKKSLLRRLKDTVAKVILGQNVYRVGRKVWTRLDHQLPNVVGAIINDEPRVEQFSQMVKSLSFMDKYALCVYLERKIHKLNNEHGELLSGFEEEYICKWTQVYSQHLEAIY